MASSFAPGDPVRPDLPGPFHIGTIEFPFWTGGPGFTLAKISYPAEYDGWMAPADTSEGSYPSVIMAPATWTGSNMYDWFTDYVVRHGYIVFRYFPENILALDPHMHADTIGDAIDKLLDIDDDRFNPLRGLIRRDAFAAVGVSLGGAGALLAAARDRRIRAVLGFAPGRNVKQAELYAGIDVEIRTVATPTLIVSGQNDRISPGSGVHYLDLVPRGYKAYVEISGGNHVQFLDPCDVDIHLPGLPRDGKPGITFAEQHAITNVYATAFLHAALKGYGHCEAHVSGAEALLALASGVLSDLRSEAGPLPLPFPAAPAGVRGAAAAAVPAAVSGDIVGAAGTLASALALRVNGLVRDLARGVERVTTEVEKRIAR
ncbi:hypothetical protein B4N89_33540 [Embleya scabrispora]|uniref:PET hydrolase/cutinase-like domain-containing protein n=1 Tax=Embleya scabrispora TaxID=159449 RepID=A0A1T3NQP6_9ACTN|nr:hypothetical protein [Embleya scabrispora]OPC79030.1 hypothetical protein B4N89_33540 [Embleya scabrispora]